jgi:hypothetical protein
MSPSAKEYEEFASDCVRLAGQVDAPELRDKLLNIARDWMRAAMEEERGQEAWPPPKRIATAQTGTPPQVRRGSVALLNRTGGGFEGGAAKPTHLSQRCSGRGKSMCFLLGSTPLRRAPLPRALWQVPGRR